MARREELWTVKVGKRIAKLKRTLAKNISVTLACLRMLDTFQLMARCNHDASGERRRR